MNSQSNDMENRIIKAAESVFIEKGFSETSMSDIAAKAGINRPVLHYYFRTKEKMFQAVFGNIVTSFIPHIHDIILQNEMPLQERLDRIVDIYFGVLREKPTLPLFIIREMNRNMEYMNSTITELHLNQYVEKISGALLEEMKQGKMKTVPIQFVFFTFYGLLTTPFLAKHLAESAFLKDKDTFDDMLKEWKPYIIKQMTCLLAE